MNKKKQTILIISAIGLFVVIILYWIYKKTTNKGNLGDLGCGNDSTCSCGCSLGCAGDSQCEACKLGELTDCYAVMVDIQLIKTDEKRFQNRIDAFSELSAQDVAENYDANKFDPIIVWKDANNQIFVLSGHSRLEGMKRRGAKEIPVRFFNGSEEDAIKFARIEANRLSNAENLVEDLKAYKLMRDGEEAKGIQKASKKEIKQRFKGKTNKLEAYSYLDANGLFIEALSQENKTEFPYIERFALWTGEIRAQYPEITNQSEREIFWFFYVGKNTKINREEFFEEVEKRIALGKKRIFPECNQEGCKKLEDVLRKVQTREAFTALKNVQKYIDVIGTRLQSNDLASKVYTDEERKVLIEVGNRLKGEEKNLKRDLQIIDKQRELL
jgi:hypothetical protein